MLNDFLKLPVRLAFSHGNEINPHYLLDDKKEKLFAINTEKLKRLNVAKIALALNTYDIILEQLEVSCKMLTQAYPESKANTIKDPTERANYLTIVRSIADNAEFLERLNNDTNQS